MWLRLCLCAQVSGSSLLGEQLFQALPVETHNYFVIHNNSRSDLAAIGAHQLKYRLLVRAHIALFEWNTSLREVGLSRVAWRSAGLSEEDDFFRFRHSI